MIPTYYLVHFADFNHMYKMSTWHVVYIRGSQSLHKMHNYTPFTSTLQIICVISIKFKPTTLVLPFHLV